METAVLPPAMRVRMEVAVSVPTVVAKIAMLGCIVRNSHNSRNASRGLQQREEAGRVLPMEAQPK